MSKVRGIRGATTVILNDKSEILEATAELLREMVQKNEIETDDIASVIITMTEDLDVVFPAQAAREFLNWEHVPLMCAKEIPVAGSLKNCIRVMLHINTDKSPHEIKHIFLREAVRLRPDLVKE
ncbi:chorismate mutase [Brevibacillus laterosporus]|uniref:chorismate mutase n=1 Tax=Brevibacillus laterosporus TaxID=1465 RepID=UPI001443F7A6|nr:chorismate mutase [Brevibacillus laterosporus]NKQ18297.1 chorismate mutase [Brevibacillus laterosporus]WNX33071.1 chorismate mutase [Brevibacillus laterosporus]